MVALNNTTTSRVAGLGLPVVRRVRSKMTASATVTTTKTTSSTSATPTRKKRILCLHGRCQSGSMMSNKIAGARKILQRVYDLDFLDAPFEIQTTAATGTKGDDNEANDDKPKPKQFEWWTRNDDVTGQPNKSNINEAFDYVLESTKNVEYDAIIGFSQGGLLGTAMVVMGAFPTCHAVITAGSPYRQEPFEVVATRSAIQSRKDQDELKQKEVRVDGTAIPKLHFAGTTDTMVPMNLVQKLCEIGGNGQLRIHDKGHLFPTKAKYRKEMIEFLREHL